VFSAPISPGIINQKDYLELITNYNDFDKVSDNFGLKAKGLSVFDEVYFQSHNVIIVGIPTAPALKYSLNKILKLGSIATISINQAGPKDLILTEVAVCIMIGVNRDETDGIKNYEVSYLRVITK
jgi:hypothetical protein